MIGRVVPNRNNGEHHTNLSKSGRHDFMGGPHTVSIFGSCVGLWSSIQLDYSQPADTGEWMKKQDETRPMQKGQYVAKHAWHNKQENMAIIIPRTSASILIFIFIIIITPKVGNLLFASVVFITDKLFCCNTRIYSSETHHDMKSSEKVLQVGTMLLSRFVQMCKTIRYKANKLWVKKICTISFEEELR